MTPGQEGAMVAGVYARKSTDEPGKDQDAKSVTRQIERAREYAAKRGWAFDDRLVFSDEGISGAEFKNRPGLNALLDQVRQPKHHLEVLIVSEQSRLGRDTIRTLALLQALGDAGVQVWSYLDDRALSLDDEMGEVQEFMRSWAGASERRKASQRVRDKLRQLAEQGRSTGGRLYGYTTSGGQRTVKPSEAEVVKRIFEARAKGFGYFKIARALERDQIPSPSGAAHWQTSQIGSILRNETYRGVATWGRLRRTKRRGTSVVEPSPEAIIKRPAEQWRILTDAQWQAAQQVNVAAAERSWRDEHGRLKSRPLASKHLLVPFVACGVCGGSLHVRYGPAPARKEVLFCTTRHLKGAAACSNRMRVPVPFAEKAILQAFEKALVGQIVTEKFEAILEALRAAAVDPEPIKHEAAALRAEIGRLIDLAARGDVEEVHQAISARKAKLADLEARLTGSTALDGLDVATFCRQAEAALTDWRAHLKKSPATAQQVLRKILPEKLKVTSMPEGGWQFTGMTDYRKVLDEIGMNEQVWKAMVAAVEQGSKPSRTGARRGWRTAP